MVGEAAGRGDRGSARRLGAVVLVAGVLALAYQGLSPTSAPTFAKLSQQEEEPQRAKFPWAWAAVHGMAPMLGLQAPAMPPAPAMYGTSKHATSASHESAEATGGDLEASRAALQQQISTKLEDYKSAKSVEDKQERLDTEGRIKSEIAELKSSLKELTASAHAPHSEKKGLVKLETREAAAIPAAPEQDSYLDNFGGAARAAGQRLRQRDQNIMHGGRGGPRASMGFDLSDMVAMEPLVQQQQQQQQMLPPSRFEIDEVQGTDPAMYKIDIDKFHQETGGEDLSNSKCITVYGHHDGFGASYSAIISGVVYAYIHGLPFRHTPVQTLAHWFPKNDGPYTKLDDFLGLKATTTAAECVDRHHFTNIIKSFPQKAAVKQLLRNMYFSNDKAEIEPTDFGARYNQISAAGPTATNRMPSCSPSDCNVVVHVRRGDDSKNAQKLVAPQYISDAEWLGVLDKVLSDIRNAPPAAPASSIPTQKVVIPWNDNMYPPTEDGDSVQAMESAGIRLHVYSEGGLENFSAFQAWAKANHVAMRFHLNGDLRRAVHAMIVSDVLACGPSSFPGLAMQYQAGKQYHFDVGHRLLLDQPGMQTQHI